jgi:hypothetical protein
VNSKKTVAKSKPVSVTQTPPTVPPKNRRGQTPGPHRFKKGQSGNPSGGRKGVPRRVTKDMRTMMSAFLERMWPVIEEDFKKLKSGDRIALAERYMKYCVPALSSVNLSGSVDIPSTVVVKVVGDKDMVIPRSEEEVDDSR